jgi:hypothetical protein
VRATVAMGSAAETENEELTVEVVETKKQEMAAVSRIPTARTGPRGGATGHALGVLRREVGRRCWNSGTGSGWADISMRRSGFYFRRLIF